MRRPRRVLLAGGGSGGHIQPNLAIASELRRLDPSIRLLYIGSRNPLDAELVQSSGIRFVPIFTGKLRRYFDWRNFTDPFLALFGFFQAFGYLIRFWPDVVFAKGGFVSLPVAVAAFILRRPIVLHESDRVMGMSNRIVARLARTVCLGFTKSNVEARKIEMRETNHEGSRTTDILKFNSSAQSNFENTSKIIFTGNPIRAEILHGRAEEGYRLTGFRPEKPVVLVWGGSQGSAEINDLVAKELDRLLGMFQIIHITGKGKIPHCGADGGANCGYIQYEHVGAELPHLYAITFIVVGRSGANSLAEIAVLQKPNILIPLKSAAHDHQTLNAEAFEEQGASIVLRGQSLFDTLEALWRNPNQMKSMSESLKKLAKPEAADRIARILLDQNPNPKA